MFSARIAIVMSAAALAAPLSAQTLWQDMTVGMAESEVLKKYPDARSITVGGKEALATKDPVSLFGAPFNVIFQFAGGKLYEVRLQAMNFGSMRPLENPLLTYMQVSNELIKRYGQPSRVNKSSLMTSETKYFLKDGVSIELNYMKSDSMAGVSITYESSVGGDNPL